MPYSYMNNSNYGVNDLYHILQMWVNLERKRKWERVIKNGGKGHQRRSKRPKKKKKEKKENRRERRGKDLKIFKYEFEKQRY